MAGDDLSQVFDIDRKQLTRQMVDNIEHCLNEIDAAREDLKQIVASAREAQFTRPEIAAMKTIAKLRKDGSDGLAKQKLDALQRVAETVGVDLFNWKSDT